MEDAVEGGAQIVCERGVQAVQRDERDVGAQAEVRWTGGGFVEHFRSVVEPGMSHNRPEERFAFSGC
jgi:hypothetical protein